MPFPGSKNQGISLAKPPAKLEEPARDTEGDADEGALGEDRSAESCHETDGPAPAPVGIAPPAALDEGEERPELQQEEQGGEETSVGAQEEQGGEDPAGDLQEEGVGDDPRSAAQDDDGEHELSDPAAAEGTMEEATGEGAPEDSASEECTEGSPAKTDGEAAREAPKMDEAAIQEERQRLKDVVHKFVRRAFEGAPCTLLAEAGRTATKFCLDGALETLSLVSADDTSHTLIACLIANIEDVYCIADDGEGPFPGPILALLQDDEKQSVLMIVFRGPQNKLYRFCVLEESAEHCATFMEAMSCLHMYSQPQSSKLRQEVVEEHRKVNGAAGTSDADLASRVASGAADAALAQQASVGFFLRCAAVQGGKGPFGALMCKAMKLSRKVSITPLPRNEIPSYLATYGFAAQTAVLWRIVPTLTGMGSRPQLDVSVTQHIEVAGHTWYMMECTLLMQGPQRHQRLDWQVPRRLAHLRQDLHDPVKAAMGKLYQKHFAGTRFARAGGMPGTTAALHKWCTTLVHVMKSGGVLPNVVALVLRFLEAPSPELPRDVLR